MVLKVSVSSVYTCSLERAFKTPMLCDIAKVHTGYGFMPRVTHVTEDEGWGKPGFSKKVYVARSLTQTYMKRVLENIRRMIEADEPYLYA
jgi:hypothetical protein